MKNGSANRDERSQLRELLARLPDAPVASNFTARVLQAVELEADRPERTGIFSWLRLRPRILLPRLAMAVCVLTVAGLSFQQYQVIAQRQLLVRDVARVATAQPVPSVDALKDFDAIQRLSQPAQPDEKLLALLQ